jgi:hypothetical protein
MRGFLFLRRVAYGLDGSNRRALTDRQYLGPTARIWSHWFLFVEIGQKGRDPLAQDLISDSERLDVRGLREEQRHCLVRGTVPLPEQS